MEAGRGYYEDLMEAGVRIYEMQGVVLHAKTAVIDGVWSTVGSSNLDWRSVLLNNECNAVILGSAFGQQMEKMFQDDLTISKRIDPVTWDDRSFWEKLHERKSQLVEYFL
jgi:cardiolipin synthase